MSAQAGSGNDWDGKVAVITGGSTGIGRATARALAGRGMRVVLGARRADRLQETVDKLTAEGYTVAAAPTDVGDLAAVRHLADLALDRFGQVDVAMLNAGVSRGSRLIDLDLDEWNAAISTNIVGLLNGIKTFLPLLTARPGGGSLLATSSGSGVHGTYYRQAGYATTKNAQLSIMESLYGQLRDAGSPVHVGVVLPPMVRTNLGGDDLSVWDQVEKRFAAGGVAVIDPDDFAQVVVEGLEQRAFWIETTQEQTTRIYGGRDSGAHARNSGRVQAKADALIHHRSPETYLW